MKFLGARPQHEDLKLLVEDSDAVAGNLAEFDANGNPVDSGIDPDTKADKDSDAVAGNLAEFDANGNPVDSGIDPDTKADKDSDAVENNLAKFDSSGNPVDSGIASNTVPIATTQDLTFYVNPSTGSDENDGSESHPFATIAKAISLIPQIVNYNVTINLADGSYSEGITLSGYVGKGQININGNSSNPENVVISGQVYISNNAVRVIVSHFECTYVDNAAVYVTKNPAFVFIYFCICVAPSSYEGVKIEYSSTVQVNDSTISNRSIGITANYVSSVMSYINSGSSNDIGLRAHSGVIMKYSTQPGGTTGESAVGGGVIR